MTWFGGVLAGVLILFAAGAAYESIAEARDCFDRLATAAGQRLGCTLVSYGLLVDDVHLSRSIVTGRPIALASAHATSARALADVAAMLLGDAHGAGDA